MPHTALNRTGLTRIHYVRTLASAYRRFMFVIDPDWAIQNEIDAWIKIQRDPDIAHAIQKRRQSVAGLAWEFTPASDTEQDKRAGQIMTELFKQIRKFQQARFNLSSAIFRGDAWLFCNGSRRPFQVTGDEPRLWWVPDSLEQLDRNRLRIRRIAHEQRDKLRTIWEVFSVARERWEPMQNRECFIRHAYDQTEETLGYGRGLMQSIYFFWRAKEIVLMQGLAGLERWGMGLIDVEIDGAREGNDATGTTNEEIVDEWIDQVNKMRAEHVLVHDSRDKFTVKDWPAKGAEMVVKFYGMLQGAIDRMILTSKLPTGGGEEVGSFGRAKVEQEEKDETIQADREAESESFDAHLATLVWKRNRMIIREVLAAQALPMARRPKFKITQQKVENPVRNGQIINMALNSGMSVQRRQAYEKMQLTMPQEGDEVLEPRPQPTGQPGLGLPAPSPGATEGPLPFEAQPSNGNGGLPVKTVGAKVKRFKAGP